MTRTITALHRMNPADLRHTDLRDEVQGLRNVEAYSVGIAGGSEGAEAVYLPDTGRLGVAWGGPMTWADASSVESGLEMWLNDGEAWEAAN